MAHMHGVRDDDPVFSIDTDSRVIMYPDENTPMLIQNDHNSERFTFEVQHEIDGHPVESCNRIRVHFINVSAANQNEFSASMYKVDDATTSEDDPELVRFTWLIDQSATQYVGSLSFLVELSCINDAGVIEYSWHSGIFEGITVSNGMDNSDAIIGDRYDVIDTWAANVKNEILASVGSEVNRITEAAISQINFIKDLLAVDVISTRGILTQNTGTNRDKIMSQDAVTKEINAINSRIDTVIKPTGAVMSGVYKETFLFAHSNSGLGEGDHVSGYITICGTAIEIVIDDIEVTYKNYPAMKLYDLDSGDLPNEPHFVLPMHGSTMHYGPDALKFVGDWAELDPYCQPFYRMYYLKEVLVGGVYDNIRMIVLEDGKVYILSPSAEYADDEIRVPATDRISIKYVSHNDMHTYLSEELLDLRIDKDGNTHESMRDAIVSQFQAIDREIEEVADDLYNSLNIDKLEGNVSKNDKRITNLEKALNPDPFITDSESAYEKHVPANVLPYAEISKIGGISHMIDGNDRQNLLPYPYINMDAGFSYFEIEEKAISAMASSSGTTLKITDGDGTIYPAGIYIYRVDRMGYLGSVESVSLDFVNNGSILPSIIHLGGNEIEVIATESFLISQFSVTLTTSSDNSGVGGDSFDLGTYEETVIKPVFYRPTQLESSKAMAIFSVGANLFDISKALNHNFVANGDGTYTLINNGNGQRFSAEFELNIPPNSTIYYSATKKGSNLNEDFKGLQLQVFKGSTEVGIMNMNSTKVITEGATNARIYIDGNEAVGNYITVSDIQIEFGSTKTEYKPFVGTLDTFTIPEAVRNVTGYGEGISDKFHNYIEYTEDGRVLFHKCINLVELGTLSWSKNVAYDDVWEASISNLDILQVSGNYDEFQCLHPMYIGSSIATTVWNATENTIVANGATLYCCNKMSAQPTGILYYALATPEVTDITDLMPTDNFLKVEPGGTIRVVNELKHDIPTEITYQQKEAT